MLSPDDLRPAPRPPALLEIQEVDQSSPIVRATTLGIGRAHQWPSQAWDNQKWQTYLEGPHLRQFVALVQGVPAGLLSLDLPPGGDTLDEGDKLPQVWSLQVGLPLLVIPCLTRPLVGTADAEGCGTDYGRR